MTSVTFLYLLIQKCHRDDTEMSMMLTDSVSVDTAFAAFSKFKPSKRENSILSSDHFIKLSSVIALSWHPNYSMHASMPPKRTLRRLRGYPPKLQERVEVGSADEEPSPPQGASPPPGSARVDFIK